MPNVPLLDTTTTTHTSYQRKQSYVVRLAVHVRQESIGLWLHQTFKDAVGERLFYKRLDDTKAILEKHWTVEKKQSEGLVSKETQIEQDTLRRWQVCTARTVDVAQLQGAIELGCARHKRYFCSTNLYLFSDSEILCAV